MTYEEKSAIIIEQLREDRDRLLDALNNIKDEIEPTRKMYLETNDIDWLNGCDYVLSVIDKYKEKVEE